MKNKSAFFYVLILLLLAGYAPAQKESVKTFDERKLIQDTLAEKNSEDNDSLLQWKHSRDFAYMAYLDSLLRKKTDLRVDTVSLDPATGKVNQPPKKGKHLSSLNQLLNSLPLKIFFWALAIFFISFIFYKIFITNGFFKKRSKLPAEKEVEETVMGLSEIPEYDSWINEAEGKNEFNLAIRYWYLKTLKILSDKEMIYFSADKTNSGYVHEMAATGLQPEFASITHHYEYAWYGKFLIDKIKYQRMKEAFILFNKKI